MLSDKPSFTDLVGAVLGTVALAVVSYMAVVLQSEIAGGALIGVLSGAVGFFLRGRVEKQELMPTEETLRRREAARAHADRGGT